jgi:hypothetical protein
VGMRGGRRRVLQCVVLLMWGRLCVSSGCRELCLPVCHAIRPWSCALTDQPKLRCPRSLTPIIAAGWVVLRLWVRVTVAGVA